MERLMEKLELTIPPFILTRRVEIGILQREDLGTAISIQGKDSDGLPYTLFPKVVLNFSGLTKILKAQPYIV